MSETEQIASLAALTFKAAAAYDSVPSKPFGDHTPAFILRPVKLAANA